MNERAKLMNDQEYIEMQHTVRTGLLATYGELSVVNDLLIWWAQGMEPPHDVLRRMARLMRTEKTLRKDAREAIKEAGIDLENITPTKQILEEQS